MCTSSLQFDGKKIFWLICVDIPKKEVELDEKKTLFAYLDVDVPVRCTCDVKAIKDYDSGMKWFEIGNKEEFLHRRIQIQEAVRRCQINNRYSKGGKGRKKKCQAIERYHEKEINYVTTKLHLYSRLLVDLAVKHKCGRILLLNQKAREDKAKADNMSGEPFLLRNWSYYGFKDKINYKCKMVGIKMEEDKVKEDEDEE
jgi:transposase